MTLGSSAHFRGVQSHEDACLHDTGSPFTFIQSKVWERMLACGSASQNGWSETPERKWGGFHGIPLITSSRVGLNVQMGGGRGNRLGWGTRVDGLLGGAWARSTRRRHDARLLLGRDGWADFPIRKYVDINENETVLTFTTRGQRDAENAQRYSDWVDNAVGLVEPSSSTAVVARFAGKWRRIPIAVSWVKIDITNTDGTKAADGMYYIRFNKGWLPRGAVVEAGTSEIHFSHTGDTTLYNAGGHET